MVSNFFDNLYIVDPIDVNPGYCWFILKGKTFLNPFYLLFLKISFIIVNKANPYLLGLLLFYMN